MVILHIQNDYDRIPFFSLTLDNLGKLLGTKMFAGL